MCDDAAKNIEACGLGKAKVEGSCTGSTACVAQCVAEASCSDIEACISTDGSEPTTCQGTALESCETACT